MKTSYSFSSRGLDRVTEELAAVLTEEGSLEFKALFLIVHANLKARNAASGGEEMLRLRTYDKLQTFVRAGIVKKTGKEYKAVASSLATFLANAAKQAADQAAGILRRTPARSAARV